MQGKTRFIFALSFLLAFSSWTPAIANPINSAQPPQAAQQINLPDYNVFVLADERILVMMAALNIAGYDYDPSGRVTGLRAQMREDLKGIDPSFVERLR